VRFNIPLYIESEDIRSDASFAKLIIINPLLVGVSPQAPPKALPLETASF